MQVTEVNVVPVRPKDGLVAFASCVIDNSLYLGSIGVHTRPSGGYRLVFPTRTVGNTRLSVFNPINKDAGIAIDAAIMKKCDEIFGKRDEGKSDVGYCNSSLYL
ncbi:MAG: SpoVG family protein [Acetobacter sp.]|nr:SpoVG family protein [Acetobacter sp.]